MGLSVVDLPGASGDRVSELPVVVSGSGVEELSDVHAGDGVNGSGVEEPSDVETFPAE